MALKFTTSSIEDFVLLSIPFVARRDDLLWGRLVTCGRLPIGLPAARKMPARNVAPFAACRYVLLCIPFVARRGDFPVPSLRRAAMWGRLVGVPSGSGGLVIRLPAARTIPGTRLHCLRLAAMRGRLPGVPSGSGRLLIGLPEAITMPENPCTPCLWGSQSWLQPAFSRLFTPCPFLPLSAFAPRPTSIALPQPAVLPVPAARRRARAATPAPSSTLRAHRHRHRLLAALSPA